MVERTAGDRLAEPVTGEPSATGQRTVRADLIVVGLALVLVAVSSAVGMYLNRPESTVDIWAPAPPLFGRWMPHVGPGTAFAVLLAVTVVAWGQPVAARLPWRPALALGYLTAVAWTFSLAMVDGWQRGFAGRLTHRTEYLHEVPGITDIPTMLSEFTGRILAFQPDSWTTHVSGHPPGATLVFVWLDRVGLSGGAWAATLVLLAGCLVAVAVPVTVGVLAGPLQARAVLPFAALSPAAVWIGASADGMFTGVIATGIALLAVATRGVAEARPWATPCAVVAGLLLGFGIFLSYGLVLVGVVALAVVLTTRAWRVSIIAILAALAVVGVFALAGFWWLDGYHLVVQRYYQGLGSTRPYAYWVWANVAAAAIAAGPAVVAGVRRTVVGIVEDPSWRRAVIRRPLSVLVLAALLAIVLADASGLSKAEVERIWLPFMVWLLPAAALVPARTVRWWLAGQAATAIAVNHLVWTYW